MIDYMNGVTINITVGSLSESIGYNVIHSEKKDILLEVFIFSSVDYHRFESCNSDTVDDG